jgi:organic hydroperoxide reductase OsmC/OhrA
MRSVRGSLKGFPKCPRPRNAEVRWYLGLCAASGIVVLAYEDQAEGTMTEEAAGGAGQFVSVTLHPHVILAPGSDREKALALHHTAHEKCFIARSVNFPVEHAPVVEVAAAA